MIDERFKVEPGVEMPPPRRGKYPFTTMQVGDSFSFDRSVLKAIQAAAHGYGKRNGVEFTCRQVGTDVWRCWRVK